MEQALKLDLSTLKSPKSTTFPVELMVMYSIVLKYVVAGVGVTPPPKTPLVELEQALKLDLSTLKSPKSTTFPVELMVMYSIVLKYVVAGVGVDPPPKTPLVELEQALKVDLPTLKSPKSTTFPVELMVMYSIVFKYVAAGVTVTPPPKTPLVELEQALKLDLPTLKSPKSFASPVDAMVMYSIVLKYVNAGEFVNPQPKTPLVELEQALKPFLPTLKSPKSTTSPVELMVMYSIVLKYVNAGVNVVPPPKTPLVELEQALKAFLPTLKSPKSTTFPVELMVMYSITFMNVVAGVGVTPPPKTPRAPPVALSAEKLSICHHTSPL